MPSFTVENYVKTIYGLSLKHDGGVTTNAIAEALGTKAATVSDMLKKLRDRELINYKKYQGTTLTTKGKKLALSIVRKHRLWEVFLVDKLDFKWDEVHEIAEQLEHIKSEKLINQLDAFLENPTHDPHGDPIPDENGKIKPLDKKLLSKLRKDEIGICVGVKESSKDFLRYLDKINISLGSKITVLSKEYFDNSMIITVGEKQVSVSNKLTNNLFIKKVI